jgi:dienelactone hydrolase
MMKFLRSFTHLASCVAFAFLALVVSEAHGQSNNPSGAVYFNPWGPSTARLNPPMGGVPFSIKSSQEGAPRLTIPGVLYKPPERTKGAVVIIGAGGGISANREGHYARSLSSAGYAVAIIDTYGPRGVMSTIADNGSISVFDQVRDAYAARKFLIDAGYPTDRIAVMGSGRGGTIALLAADKTFVPSVTDKRFALALAVSPGCFFHPRAPQPAGSVFIAMGEKDDVVGQVGCRDWVKEYTAAGGKVTAKSYKGAASGFDGDPRDLGMFRDSTIETFVNCRVEVDGDGRAIYDGKSFAESQFASLIAEMRKSCIGRGGGGYTNLTQKANLTLDLIEFLDSNFSQ